ncbi:MAG: GntR family transcriptional regulator [candidate division NC10 bacterium]|nr:GntR family transcriptional regulator [candidate division NC10 bacterium]MBI2561423.1 GntR family transcriptional regulator [candidate division NC10 bacterium]MBI3086836.1 GntR family transcriptional regulator [candidate division NC10 bacterium]
MPHSTRPPGGRRMPRATDPPSLRIEHENLDDKIYARLKALIAERRMLPGERILQDRLAREMGVSRTPLVNALKRLAQERLVEWVSRRGIYVKRFTKREMARLFEVREALEGLAARLAAPRIGRDEVDRLVEMFRGLDVAPTPAAIRRYVERDRHFHWRLVELAGNEQLAHAMDSVNMMFFAYQDGLVRPAAETVQEHWTILEALRRKDPDASEAAMRLHIRRSVEQLEKEAEAEEMQAE